MKLSLSDIFNLLRIKKIPLSIIVFSVSLLVFVYANIAPHTYRYVITLMPPEQKSVGGISSLLQNVMPSLPMGGIGSGSTQYTSVDVLASNAVCTELANMKEISEAFTFLGYAKEEQISQIRKTISVENRRSGVTGISVTLITPFFPNEESITKHKKLLLTIASNLPTAVDNVLHKKSSSTAKKTRIFIERVLSKHKKELDSVQTVIQEFQQKNNVIGIDAQTSAMVTNTASLSTELAKTEMQLSLAQQEYASSSPYIMALQKQIETINTQLQRMQTVGLVNFDKTTIRVDSIPSLTKQYINLIRSQKVLEQIIAYLETQRLQESIQEEKDVPSVQVLDAAFGTPEKVSPKPLLMTMLAAIVSLVLSVCWIFISALKSH